MDSRNIARDKQTSSQFTKAHNIQRVAAPSMPDYLQHFEHCIEEYTSGHKLHDTKNIPPLSFIKFLTVETENTTPDLLRSSLYCIPTDYNLFSSLALPFTITFQPFNSNYDPPHFNASFCHQCSTYVSNTTKLNKEGFVCNLCGCKNISEFNMLDVPPTYNLILERSENKDKMLYVHQEYFKDVIKFDSPVFIFCLSYIHKNVLKLIKLFINDDLFLEFYKKCVFILYDKRVKLYRVFDNEIEEVVVFDSSFFASSEYFMSIDELNLLIDALLNDENVSDLIIETKESERNIDGLLSVLVVLSKITFGSRTLFFASNKLLTFDSQFSNLLNENNNSLNVVCDNENGLEKLCVETSGVFIKECYQCIKENEEIEFMPSWMINILTIPFFDVAIKLKTSNALKCIDICANTLIENTFQAHFAYMDSLSTISFGLTIDESMKEDQDVYIQGQIEYTNFTGIRNLLVVNQKFKASQKLHNIFNGISLDSLFYASAKGLAFQCMNKERISNKKTEKTKSDIIMDLYKVRGQHSCQLSSLFASTKLVLPESLVSAYLKDVKEGLVGMLKFYRQSVARSISQSQLILPESVKVLPLLYLAMTKNICFFNPSYSNLAFVNNLNIPRLFRFFYPKIINFTDYYLSKEEVFVPACLVTFSIDSIYLIDTGFCLYIYVGNGFVREISVKNDLVRYDKRDTYYKFVLYNSILVHFMSVEEIECIVEYFENLCDEYGVKLDIKVLKQGNDVEIKGFMAEDPINNYPSYVDFLCELHLAVRE